MTIRVFLVDDHAILRQGLRLILEAEPDLRVVGEAGDGREAVTLVQEMHPDIVLMDISMARLNGIDATARLRFCCPSVRVIILSMLATRDHIYGALQAGAQGYLLKECLGREVVDAVRRVADGHRFLGQGAAELLAADAARGGELAAASSPLCELSLREREVLQLLAEGRAPKEIAAELGISPKTIDTYRHRIMAKLGLDNLAALVKFAVRHGVTTLHS